MLREWYGPEFAIFKRDSQEDISPSLADILAESPEKRKTIMDYLSAMINQLIQKKLTGFTMLHDAMLQYYLNCKPGSDEAWEFQEKLKGEGDQEETDHDLLKNLAFTASGSRVVCLALARGTAKDRRVFLKVYKDMVEMLQFDENGHKVLLAAVEVIDDTKAVAKALFPLLTAKPDVSDELQQQILAAAASKEARIHLLSPFALHSAGQSFPKWLLSPPEMDLLRELHEARTATSKKDPTVRRKEIIAALSPSLLSTVQAQAATLLATTEGCQFVTEILLGAAGPKDDAIDAVLRLAAGDASTEEHIAQNPSVARMFKALIQGGHFDSKSKAVHQTTPSTEFCDRLYSRVEQQLLSWATGPGVWVILALAEQTGWQKQTELLDRLQGHKSELKQTLTGLEAQGEEGSNKSMLSGLRLLLGKLE
jgi:pumilio homology domain family member 6